MENIQEILLHIIINTTNVILLIIILFSIRKRKNGSIFKKNTGISTNNKSDNHNFGIHRSFSNNPIPTNDGFHDTSDKSSKILRFFHSPISSPFSLDNLPRNFLENNKKRKNYLIKTLSNKISNSHSNHTNFINNIHHQKKQYSRFFFNL